MIVRGRGRLVGGHETFALLLFEDLDDLALLARQLVLVVAAVDRVVVGRPVHLSMEVHHHSFFFFFFLIFLIYFFAFLFGHRISFRFLAEASLTFHRNGLSSRQMNWRR